MSHATRARRLSSVLVIGTLAAAQAASADPAPGAPAAVGAITPERADRRPHSCAEPGCRDERTDGRADLVRGHEDGMTRPVDVRIPIGEIAVASMEGVWLRRGPTLRNEPIMVSPIVVGDALTLALGGRF
jgi:hypothetical protein